MSICDFVNRDGDLYDGTTGELLVKRQSIYLGNPTNPGPGDFPIFRISRELMADGCRIDRGYHDRQTLYYVISGRGFYCFPEQTWELTTGMVFAVSGGNRFTCHCEPGETLEYYLLSFDTDEIPLIRQTLGASTLAIRPSSPKLIESVVDVMFQSARDSEPLAYNICRDGIPLMLTLARNGVVRDPVSSSLGMSTYYRCRTYIDQNFESIRSVNDIAKACSIDRSHLGRLFKRFGETTVRDYLVRLKMNMSADLLSSSDLLVAEIAERMGYSDPFTFSKVFKRVFHLSPRDYRKR